MEAPSTLGTFLRAFTFGHVRQLGAVAAALLVKLTVLAALLPAAAAGDRDAVTWMTRCAAPTDTSGKASATDTTR